MKKTLGLLAVVGAAAALVAYTMKKEERVEEKKTLPNNDTMEFEEDQMEVPASTASITYGNLTEEDTLHLNEICEQQFSLLENDADARTERPLQHVIAFEQAEQLEAYKTKVIHDGYVVTAGENEKELVVLNIVKVDTEIILENVFYLANLAKEYNGTYVSWILK